MTYLTKLPGIWQIWWYLITNSELFAEEIHLFAIKYHPFCQIPGSFVKYVKYLSNISVFDRNYLMKKWSFGFTHHTFCRSARKQKQINARTAVCFANLFCPQIFKLKTFFSLFWIDEFCLTSNIHILGWLLLGNIFYVLSLERYHKNNPMKNFLTRISYRLSITHKKCNVHIPYKLGFR